MYIIWKWVKIESNFQLIKVLGTPFEVDMVSQIPLKFHLEEPYKDHIESYQRKTRLTKIVQIVKGLLNSITIGLWIFSLLGVQGSMDVVGKNPLFDRICYQSIFTSYFSVYFYRNKHARRLSLMQMAKKSC